jgi:hypothetical protein
VTVTVKVEGEPRTVFVNCAVIRDPDGFTVVTDGCRMRVGEAARFTIALGVKFAPMIVSVKLLWLDGMVPGGKLVGDTWVIRGTAFGGTV